MDQEKVGQYLKELRKTKGITQEDLAEQVGVSRRTVSRWETGTNMPDMDVMIELADYYDVDLRDLLRGEKKEESMDQELKETVLMVAEYDNEEKRKVMQRLHVLYWIGIAASVFYLITIFYLPEEHAGIYDMLQGVSLGIAFGMLLVGLIITGRNAAKIRETKLRILERIGLRTDSGKAKQI